MVKRDLPNDIMVKIFLRIPIKFVGRCRCLSKTWANDLCNHKFVRSYSAFKNRQENLMFLNYNGFLEIIPLPLKDDNMSRNVLPNTEWREFVGSCNGLVLLLNTEFHPFLVNPITLQHVAIPNPYLNIHNIMTFSYGFGYDILTDDYKVLALSHHVTMNGRLESILDVYSVKTRSWRRINTSSANTIYGAYSGAFINGAVHWHSNGNALGDASKILAFDLCNEVFHEIPLPTRACGENFPIRKLTVLEGCLCMVDWSDATGETNIYIMKEYGQANSWTKFSMNFKFPWDIYDPLYFNVNKELVFEAYGSEVLVCNFQDETTRHFVANGYQTTYASGVIFTESLMSPNEHAAFA